MMKQSAGILLYRDRGQGIEVLLVHPGGPFWARKDAGAWSIPKGEFLEDEEPFIAAKREFSEELGLPAPDGPTVDLGSVQQSGSKTVFAWAIQSDLDVSVVVSNMFELEWPPKSGDMKQFPEIDRAGWFTLDVAQTRIVKGQLPLLQKLADALQITFPEAVPMEVLVLPAKPKKLKDSIKKSSSDGGGQTSLF